MKWPPSHIVMARIVTVLYFAYFSLMPVYTKLEAVRAVPERVPFD